MEEMRRSQTSLDHHEDHAQGLGLQLHTSSPVQHTESLQRHSPETLTVLARSATCIAISVTTCTHFNSKVPKFEVPRGSSFSFTSDCWRRTLAIETCMAYIKPVLTSSQSSLASLDDDPTSPQWLSRMGVPERAALASRVASGIRSEMNELGHLADVSAEVTSGAGGSSAHPSPSRASPATRSSAVVRGRRRSSYSSDGEDCEEDFFASPHRTPRSVVRASPLAVGVAAAHKIAAQRTPASSPLGPSSPRGAAGSSPPSPPLSMSPPTAATTRGYPPLPPSA